ncbi:MAG: tyrosine-protein phosphatase [Limnobaculum xujianqingii]
MSKIKSSLLITAVLLSPLAINTSYATQTEASSIAINQQLINENGHIERDGNRLVINWKGMPEQGKTTIHWFDVVSAKSHPLEVIIKDGKATFEDPNPGHRTLFQLPDANSKTITLAERKVPAAGLDNLRDLGGLKTSDGRYTKWGVMYRADTPYKLKPEGYRYVANNMKMGHIFDLRAENEVVKKPDPAMEGVTYYHTQIPDSPPAYKDVSWETTETIYNFVSTPRAESFYVDTNAFMVEAPKSHDSMKHILSTALTAEGKGMLWHCAGGKDRTGYVSAVFLAALGVPDETIVNEYLLTNEYRKEFDRKELEDMSKEFKQDPKAIKGFLAIQQSRPEYIMAALNLIKQKYGSDKNYLDKEMCITTQQIEQLKQMYTE